MDKPHKHLDVWKLSMELAVTIYHISVVLPAEEKFGLASQLKRAATSVPSNIAEGAARSSNKQFRHFLSIARGSLSELDTQLDLCLRLNFLSQESWRNLDIEMLRIDKMLYALQRSKRA